MASRQRWRHFRVPNWGRRKPQPRRNQEDTSPSERFSYYPLHRLACGSKRKSPILKAKLMRVDLGDYYLDEVRFLDNTRIRILKIPNP